MALRRRRKEITKSGPKTYIYVSDAKVEMLTAGLPRTLRDQVDVTLKTGIPDIAEVEVKRRSIEPSRYERAERLCRVLERQGRVGSALDGGYFMRGTIIASWGFYGRNVDGYADVAFFTGFESDGTMIGLGGSAYYTTERAEERLQRHSNSGIQAIMEFLKEQSEVYEPRHYLPSLAWPAEVRDTDHDRNTLPQEIEFVAVRLKDDTAHAPRTVLGSPIFVANTGRPLSRELVRDFKHLRNAHALEHGRIRRPSVKNDAWRLGSVYDHLMPPLDDPDPPALPSIEQ